MLTKLLIAVCFVTMTTGLAVGKDIAANTAKRSALPGYAYDSQKETFLGDACLKGTETSAGPSTSSFSFTESLSETQASRELGLAIGGSARYGVVDASLSSTFMQNSTSNAYSVSGVWRSYYFFPATKLTNVEYTNVGNRVKGNGRWAETCGDQYVDEITKGAELFFSIRVEFASKEAKSKFTAAFSLSGPLFSANAKLENASREFSRNTIVVVSAYQVGGDVSKLTGIFGNNEDGRKGFVECTLGNFAKCASTVAAALSYAADTKTGFPAQIAPDVHPGPSPITYKTADYSAAGFYEGGFPILNQVNKEARKRLEVAFENQFSLMILSNRLLKLKLGENRSTAIAKQNGVLRNNVDKIVETATFCYADPLKCSSAEKNLVLSQVDEQELALPPPPVGSFRLFTSNAGLFPRSSSILEFSQTEKTSATTCDPPLSFDCNRYTYWQRRPLQSVAPRDESASVVLFIEGVALREASVYFEGQSKAFATIDLAPESSPFRNKVTETSAMLVLETTRPNPGWQDIDLAAYRHQLESTIPSGDGYFYVVIKDELGRQTEFDLQYQKWKRQADGSTEVIYRDRWADPKSGGTSVAGTGDWSEYAITQDVLH